MNVDKMGRGLEAILGSSLSSATNTETSQETKDTESNFIMLDPRVLKPNPYQPRRTFDDETLEELSSSIKAHGVIQPVIAQKDIDGSYFIVAGERRTRASILAGLEKIPVVLSDIKEESKLEVALIENIQRENLNPIEEAKAYQAIIEMGNITQNELSQRVGKSRPAITNALRLLQLSPEMQNALKQGIITAGHAKVLLGIEDEGMRETLFEDIREKHLSVREAEKYATISKRKEESKKQSKPQVSVDKELKDIEEQFISRFGTKVTIKGNIEKGVVEIEYFSKEGLDQIYDVIMKK